ncbi:MAG: hypothetical protein ACREIN_03635, partial [Candidatus Methylomirabilaceae bacterium]
QLSGVDRLEVPLCDLNPLVGFLYEPFLLIRCQLRRKERRSWRFRLRFFWQAGPGGWNCGRG